MFVTLTFSTAQVDFLVVVYETCDFVQTKFALANNSDNLPGNDEINQQDPTV
jgi:hypothetical protein